MASLFDFFTGGFRNKKRGGLLGIGPEVPDQQAPAVLSPEIPAVPVNPPQVLGTQAPAPEVPGAPPAVQPPPVLPAAPVAPTVAQPAEETPTSDIETLLAQIQGLKPEQKTLLGFGGETPEQKTQREGLQGSLDRLISLRGQLETAQAPTEAMTSLDTLIAEQQKGLRGFETSRYLQDRPGILDIGGTQSAIAARAAREAEPITRALSDLLISRSVLGQQQQQKAGQIEAQIGGIESEVELRKALAGLAAPGAKLPEGITSKLFEKLITPVEETTDIREYNLAKKEGYTGEFVDYQERNANLKKLSLPLSQDLNRLLTADEAIKFGVPAGTTFAQVLGVTPLSVDQRKQLATKSGALAALNEVKKISGRVNNFGPGPAGVNRLIKGAANWYGAITQTNPDAAQLNAQSGILAQIVRGLGEVGTLATKDVERVLALIPNGSTTREVATRNITEVENILKASKEGVIGAAQTTLGPQAPQSVEDYRLKYGY